MAGVNYDEAIHKVYSRKKAAIDETSSAVGFFFSKAFFWQHISKLNMCASMVGKQFMRLSLGMGMNYVQMALCIFLQI